MLKTCKAVVANSKFIGLLLALCVLAYVSLAAAMLITGAVPSTLIFQLDLHVAILEVIEPRVRWRCTQSAARRRRLMALTIDDVPLLENDALEEILDILKEHDVKATLFVMSGFCMGKDEAVRKRIEALLLRAVAEGHELGNHQMYDEPAFALAPSDLEVKFAHCDKLLRKLQPLLPPRWHRPGSAIWTQKMLEMGARFGYEAAVLANCFPHDTAAALTPLHRFMLVARARPGCVALVHDRHYTPATLRYALPRLKAKGLQCVTLSTLFDAVEDTQETTVRSPHRVP